jgi:hypothetical protein
MRPERRLQRRNGGAAHSPPQNETQKTPPDISLLRAKNGLDNGVHLNQRKKPGVSNAKEGAKLGEMQQQGFEREPAGTYRNLVIGDEDQTGTGRHHRRGPYWKRFNNDWRVWVAMVITSAAVAMYFI